MKQGYIDKSERVCYYICKMQIFANNDSQSKNLFWEQQRAFSGTLSYLSIKLKSVVKRRFFSGLPDEGVRGMVEVAKITFDRLVRLRFGEKATQRVIAHKLDIAESVYSMLKNGWIPKKESTIANLAEKIGCAPALLNSVLKSCQYERVNQEKGE